MTESQIESIKVARLEPGDVLVLKCKEYLRREVAEGYIAAMKSLVPQGVDVLLLDGGTDVEVLRKAEADAAAS